MKRAILLLLAVVAVTSLTGCDRQRLRHPFARFGGGAAETCEAGCDASCEAACGATCEAACEEAPVCERERLLDRFRCCRAKEVPEAGPQTGAITYPYYTTRGPRDFLAKNPPSIGP